MRTWEELQKVRAKRFKIRISKLLGLKRKAVKLTSSVEKLKAKKAKSPVVHDPNIKRIHLKLEEAILKKTKIEETLSSEELKDNKTKRKRLFQELAHLNRAIQNPEVYLVDPEKEKRQKQKDEKRRIEKKLAKSAQKKKEHKKEIRYKKHCLKCNSIDHIISECPETQTGYCFKCGSKQHTHTQCKRDKFDCADCFVCGLKGHIARQCPKNEKGLYIKGGSCFGCGSVRHTLKECPVRHGKKMAKTDELF